MKILIVRKQKKKTSVVSLLIKYYLFIKPSIIPNNTIHALLSCHDTRCEAAFASLLVNNLSNNYAVGSNCEEDFCSVFHTFDELFFKKQTDTLDFNEIDFEDMMLNDHIIDYKEKENNPTLKA